jgi:lysophospholipase L1-like esterase
MYCLFETKQSRCGLATNYATAQGQPFANKQTERRGWALRLLQEHSNSISLRFTQKIFLAVTPWNHSQHDSSRRRHQPQFPAVARRLPALQTEFLSPSRGPAVKGNLTAVVEPVSSTNRSSPRGEWTWKPKRLQSEIKRYLTASASRIHLSAEGAGRNAGWVLGVLTTLTVYEEAEHWCPSARSYGVTTKQTKMCIQLIL